MEYRYLGRSGLQVSEICFGVMSFTGSDGWTHIARTDQKEADRVTAYALEQGINFFDTADVYSLGRSEKMLGHALMNRRHEAVIATKCGFRMYDGPNGDGLSRKRILEACDASLKRLNTDYIDLYQIHSFDFFTPLEETIAAFDTLVTQGKLRYIGLSNFYAWQLMKAMALCEKYGWHKFVSLQAYYSMLGRDLEIELVPACLDQGLGILPWSPLHGGILSGKYHRQGEWPSGTRIAGPEDSLPYNRDQGELVLDEVIKIAKTKNKTPAQVALNYLLQKPGVNSVVIGARNMEQLKANTGASGWQLDSQEMVRLDDLSKPPRLYPQWYFEYFRKDQLDQRLEGKGKREK